MFLTEIDHVQIAAPPGCEDAARAFFGGLLRLEEIEKLDVLNARGGCWFKIGLRQLHIGIERDFRPAQKAHPAFAVSEIDKLFERMTAAGVKCAWDDAIRRDPPLLCKRSLGQSTRIHGTDELSPQTDTEKSDPRLPLIARDENPGRIVTSPRSSARRRLPVAPTR